MKGKPLWCIGLALGAGVIFTDRFLHLFPRLDDKDTVCDCLGVDYCWNVEGKTA